jgi:membrane protease YdiL (CAAX protease family)
VSARADAIRAEWGVDMWTSAGVVATGCLLLMLRIEVIGRPGSGLLVAAVSGAILAAATLAPVPLGVRGSSLGPLAVGLAGLVAVVAAAAVGGPPIPAPVPAWAPAMNIFAAIGEEALFRRTAYGWLERFGPLVAVIATALLFALVHVPVYGTSVLPIDLGAGLLFGWQRWAGGTWSAPAATHVVANLLTVLR